MSEEDFRDFVFINPIKLHAGMNPNFFKGTILEHEADKVLADLRAEELAANTGDSRRPVDQTDDQSYVVDCVYRYPCHPMRDGR